MHAAYFTKVLNVNLSHHDICRIKYCAIRCTMSLLASDTPEDEDEQWEDVDEEGSDVDEVAVDTPVGGFRSTYGDIYLPLLCDIIQASSY